MLDCVCGPAPLLGCRPIRVRVESIYIYCIPSIINAIVHSSTWYQTRFRVFLPPPTAAGISLPPSQPPASCPGPAAAPGGSSLPLGVAPFPAASHPSALSSIRTASPCRPWIRAAGPPQPRHRTSPTSLVGTLLSRSPTPLDSCREESTGDVSPNADSDQSTEHSLPDSLFASPTKSAALARDPFAPIDLEMAASLGRNVVGSFAGISSGERLSPPRRSPWPASGGAWAPDERPIAPRRPCVRRPYARGGRWQKHKPTPPSQIWRLATLQATTALPLSARPQPPRPSCAPPPPRLAPSPASAPPRAAPCLAFMHALSATPTTVGSLSAASSAGTLARAAPPHRAGHLLTICVDAQQRLTLRASPVTGVVNTPCQVQHRPLPG
jgi:hypothetical protein